MAEAIEHSDHGPMTIDVEATAAAIVAAQWADGGIAREPGGLLDPWNHIEAAMGLDTVGRHAAATRAYQWLARTQSSDGCWYVSYRGARPVERVADGTATAYVAVGALHHYLCTDDDVFLRELWPTVEAALEFVLRLQRPTGEIPWRRQSSGQVGELALLTGNCAVYHAIRCAMDIAAILGDHHHPRWTRAARLLRDAIVGRPELFVAKPHAMDWYYPVLAGVLDEDDARARLDGGWHRFVAPANGVRGTPDESWTTGGEAAELALTLAVLGDARRGAELLSGLHGLRHHDGSSWTGYDYETGHFWPPERSTWTAGVTLLAAAALRGHRPTIRTFGRGTSR
ncbi:MAG TPA: prenyltransferase [Pseudonocardiaceae bacterium]|nr:prenyltransferase [Pseudonocardiaceae bacterium]